MISLCVCKNCNFFTGKIFVYCENQVGYYSIYWCETRYENDVFSYNPDLGICHVADSSGIIGRLHLKKITRNLYFAGSEQVQRIILSLCPAGSRKISFCPYAVEHLLNEINNDDHNEANNQNGLSNML